MTSPTHPAPASSAALTDPIDQSLPAVSELTVLAEQALDRVRQSGADSAAVGVSQSVGLTVTVRAGEVESIEFQRDRDLGLTVYRNAGDAGVTTGSASTADWSPVSLSDIAMRADDIARLTEADAYAGLADAALMATEQQRAVALDLHHPWAVSVAEAIDLARKTEAAAMAADDRIDHSEGASVSTSASIHLLANSHGFVGHGQSTSHSISAAVVARDGERMERDYWYTSDRVPSALSDPESVGRRAGERAAARLGGAPIATATMPVLFVPELARGLIGHFMGAISGGSLYRKHSFLLDAMNEPVFPDWLRIHQQPHLQRAAGSAAFDREGVATRHRDLITDGRLAGWLLGSYSARRLGLATTGNAGGAFNVLVDAQDAARTASFDGLLAEMGDGLVVTELMGQSINMTSGDYSRGAAGFVVRGGKIAEPVSEVTLAGNLRKMYADIRAVGTDIDRRGNCRTGSILIDNVMVAGR